MNTTGSAEKQLLEALQALWAGDLSYRMPESGETLEIARQHNRFLDRLQEFQAENNRITREIGTEGLFGGQAEVEDLHGVWKELTDNLNTMAAHLTEQIRTFASAITAIANGDFTRKVSVKCQGEMLEWKDTINVFVDQLNSFAYEVTYVSRDIGSEGKLGAQAEVRGAAGTWKDLIANVNTMSANLTDQLRTLAEVTTAIARGDLSKKAVTACHGEILVWQDTVNRMVDKLNAYASEVTRVLREVGTDGILGGQVMVQNVEGTWKDLVDSTNWAAAHLTDQIRDFAHMVDSLKKGDTSRTASVPCRGEVLELRDSLNALAERLRSSQASSG